MYYHDAIEQPYLPAAQTSTITLCPVTLLSLHQCTNFPISAIVTSTIKPSKHKKPAA